MGQKINPEGLRIGIIKGWKSKWLAKKNFKDLLLEDFTIRKYIKEKLYSAGISKIEIERAGNKAILKIYTAKPGMIIGRKGAEVEELRKALEKLTGKQMHIEPKEVNKPEIDAQLVSENIAQQLEKRISYRRAMKKAMQTSMAPDSGAQGIKVQVSGRLGGAEIARREWYVEGRVPLQTLRADIDFGVATAFTPYGTIGVKVWIFKGEILPELKK
ncbi:MAG: 30S ribosomal protein S3 [Spirochaetia bacterium]|nr:30S ribosomal protein S3 [Spirochaetia bacterium]